MKLYVTVWTLTLLFIHVRPVNTSYTATVFLIFLFMSASLFTPTDVTLHYRYVNADLRHCLKIKMVCKAVHKYMNK